MQEQEKKASACHRADEYVHAGLYHEAITIYHQLVDSYPDDESFLLSLAWAYHDSGDTEKAIEYFEMLFQRELVRGIFTGFAYDELVRLYKHAKRYDRLVNICEKAVRVYSGDGGLLGDLADAYLKAGNVEGSIITLKRIIARDPDAVEMHCKFGDAFVVKGEFQQAENAYDRAAEIDPDAACPLYGRLADSCKRAGKYGWAERAIAKCLEIRPDDPLYHCMAGDSLIGQGKLIEAQLAYEEAVALSPSAAGDFYNRWGNSLAAACYYHEAIAVFERALTGDQDNALYQARIAQIYQMLSGKTLGHPRGNEQQCR